jgi:hypothetical protein
MTTRAVGGIRESGRTFLAQFLIDKTFLETGLSLLFTAKNRFLIDKKPGGLPLALSRTKEYHQGVCQTFLTSAGCSA